METKEKQQVKKVEFNRAKYNKFIQLYFLNMIAKLKKEAKKELKELEDEVKTYPGKKPKMTKTVNLGTGKTHKIVEGIAVPDDVLKDFKDHGRAFEYYF